LISSPSPTYPVLPSIAGGLGFSFKDYNFMTFDKLGENRSYTCG